MYTVYSTLLTRRRKDISSRCFALDLRVERRHARCKNMPTSTTVDTYLVLSTTTIYLGVCSVHALHTLSTRYRSTPLYHCTKLLLFRLTETTLVVVLLLIWCNMGDSAYSFSLTTFSRTGKLLQIEYALNAVANGRTSLGICTKDGVVIATDKKLSSPLVDIDHVHKVEQITPSCGFVYSGVGPDYRVLGECLLALISIFSLYLVYLRHISFIR